MVKMDVKLTYTMCIISLVIISSVKIVCMEKNLGHFVNLQKIRVRNARFKRYLQIIWLRVGKKEMIL